ncbi:hypothetical protein MIMGU_mgv1a025518mg [Erythranthe guttata]|uniref:RNase III domain-containing protein n=1 Tax=Erythranthe guttata TaxID=4155 RepID=A0A022RRC5_ERYGU|nr:hypothetical protein MIMGU_mgv1a025518mg [Erythranthe guttata]
MADAAFKLTTPFSVSLDTLQNQINYTFNNVGLLRRAMTHASFSEETTRHGTRLGLQNIVRVSHKTDATAPAVVCGAFRAVCGAIAVDAGSSDVAGRIYGKIHGGIGRADF